MPLSTEPVARYKVRKPSEFVVARSVSERTVEERENAIAASAADIHSTASRAPPFSLLIRIRTQDISIDVNRNMQRRNRQPRRIKLARRHLHAYGGRQIRTVPRR